MKTFFFLLTIISQVGLAEVSSGIASKTPSTEKDTVAAKAPVESEIPLNLEAEKKNISSDGMAGRVFYSIAILAILGGGMFYFVKRYSIPKTSKSQAQIKILSQHYFGPKKSVALIRIAGESMLIGITDNSINLVKSLSLLDEDVPEEIPQNFSRTLESKTDLDPKVQAAEDEEFAISGIRDVVQRKLQGMRNI